MIYRLWSETQKFIANHVLLFIFLLVLFSISMLFGAIVVQALQLNQKSDLYVYFNNFLSYRGQLQMPASQLFFETLSQNMKYLGLLWILGLSVIGLPVIVIMVFVKGFSLGFTIAFLVEQYSYKGLQLAMGVVLPQNLILVPVTLFIGVSGIVFSIQLIQNRILQAGESLFSKFVHYLMMIVISFLLILLASFYEAYFAPYFYRILEIV